MLAHILQRATRMDKPDRRECVSGPSRGDGPPTGKGGPNAGSLEDIHPTAIDLAEKRNRERAFARMRRLACAVLVIVPLGWLLIRWRRRLRAIVSAGSCLCRPLQRPLKTGISPTVPHSW